MKKIKIIVYLSIVGSFLITSCSNNKEGETTSNSNQSTSIELKETPVKELGLSVGLPKDWSIAYCCCYNKDSIFEISRAGKVMISIKLDSKMKDTPMNIILNNFTYEEGKDEPIKEEGVGDDALKRTGAIGKGSAGSDTGLVTTFYYRFNPNIVDRKPIIVEPSSDYLGIASDTCIAIIKSIKALK